MKSIPLSRGYSAIVDDDDYAALLEAGPWWVLVVGRRIYPQHSIRRADGTWSKELMHKFLTGWPETDHRNSDGLDNRRANLRPATRSQNNANARTPAHNKSGYKGVHQSGRKWVAQIQVNYKRYSLGYFDTPEEAARAYDAAALSFWGEYARLNLPQSADTHRERHGIWGGMTSEQRYRRARARMREAS